MVNSGSGIEEVEADEAGFHPYDENLLERSRTQWQFGDWERLARLDRTILQHHPDRAKLALLAASGCAHQGKFSSARQFSHLASEWGCGKQLIRRVLISDVHNTLARASTISGQKERALRNYRNAITVGNPGGDLSLLMQARIREQCSQIGIDDSNFLLASSQEMEADGSQPLLPTRIRANSVDKVMQQFRSQLKREIYDELKSENPYGHNRLLTRELNAELREFFKNRLGRKGLKPAYITYLATKALQTERNGVGRLATTIQDAVVRQLVADCITGNRIGILEIGSLYGIGLALLYNHAITWFDRVEVACIDPFEGYYGKPTDALLNTPVNQHAFVRNMKLANVPREDYHLIHHYSTAPEALKAATGFTFNLLIIDGDHGHDGVKFDFEHYFPMLEPGGYVILDDYNAQEWPGVQKFVDEDLCGYPGVEYIGAVSRTAIARKTV
jgi:hypothetical protein